MIFFLGLLFSFSVVFTSALGIGLLKKLPEWRELRFAFMLLSGIVSATAVVLLVSRLSAFGTWHLSDMTETTEILLQHCIACIIVSIFFTRDLIIKSTLKITLPSTENTEQYTHER
jgi:hypothetical protein